MVDWVTEEDKTAVDLMLQNLLPKLKAHSIVAVSSLKKMKTWNENYKKLYSFNIGKRQIIFLQPIL